MKNNKDNLDDLINESAIAISNKIKKAFNIINRCDLTACSYRSLIEFGIGIGRIIGKLESDKDFYGKIPDYEKAKTRAKIMQQKLYKEAERRDGGF